MVIENQTKTHFIPVTQLKTYNVVNGQGEDLGQVQNFILDMCSTRIAYALVAFEGFLGLTDKWIPIPFKILNWEREKSRFSLDVSRKGLEKAPAISKSEWPDKFLEKLEMKDHSAWLETVYDYYDCEPYWVERECDSCNKPETAGKRQTHFIPTSRLKSYPVVDDRSDSVGDVERIIIDLYSGRVVYMLVGLKGHANGRWVAVPPDAMTWETDTNDFRLDISREVLATAPTIPKADWPNKFLADLEDEEHAQWVQDVYDYYEYRPFWIIVE